MFIANLIKLLVNLLQALNQFITSFLTILYHMSPIGTILYHKLPDNFVCTSQSVFRANLLLLKTFPKKENGNIFFLQNKSVQQDAVHLVDNFCQHSVTLLSKWFLTSSIADVVFCSSSQLKTATWDAAPVTRNNESTEMKKNP